MTHRLRQILVIGKGNVKTPKIPGPICYDLGIEGLIAYSFRTSRRERVVYLNFSNFSSESKIPIQRGKMKSKMGHVFFQREIEQTTIVV